MEEESVSPQTQLLRFETDASRNLAPADIPNVFSYAFTTVPRLPDPDADPDSPESDVYGGEGGSGYYGGVGGGPGGPDSALKTELGTLAGLGFGYVDSLSLWRRY